MFTGDLSLRQQDPSIFPPLLSKSYDLYQIPRKTLCI